MRLPSCVKNCWRSVQSLLVYRMQRTNLVVAQVAPHLCACRYSTLTRQQMKFAIKTARTLVGEY